MAAKKKSAKKSTKKSARPKNRPLWKMRKYEGKGYVDTRKAPKWWLSRPAEVEEFLRGLKGVKVEEIGHSAGGHPIIMASYGKREDLPGRTCASLAAAIAGGDPEAFYGKGARKRQGFCFVGAAHGTEFEGTVAAANVFNILATGKDLRGRKWPRLQKEARKLRFTFIPFLNMDGRMRFDEIRHIVNAHPEDGGLISQGLYKDGTRLKWPTSKLTWPLPLEKLEILGSYFNDNGINLVYDNGIGGTCQPETAALVRFIKEEMPDCVMLSHTNNGSLICEISSFIPAHFRQRVAQISAVAGMACAEAGYAKSAIVERTDTYAGQIFYQADMIYHACGALPLLAEFPCGYQNNPPTHGEVLDICLKVIEETISFGTAKGFRPRDPRWK
jgi:hypothetical protein